MKVQFAKPAQVERYRFATSWADAHSGYDEGQVVTLGAKYGPDEFPRSHGEQLIAGGVLVLVASGDRVRETAALG
jgi:hypothetical protein